MIINGPYIPKIRIDGFDVPIFETNWDEHDIKMTELNAKTMNVLYCTLDANKFNKFFTYNSTKDI